MVAYATPVSLAQRTPGELSKDQAVPNFYYMDKNNDNFLLRWSYLLFPTGESFWDSVATSLEVGSYITCLGSAGTTGDLGLSVATVRVISITPAESEYRYQYRVQTQIGPNSLYGNQSFGPGAAFRSNISGSNLVYRGIIQCPVVAGPVTSVTLGNEGIDSECWCVASVTNKPQGAPYVIPYVISWVYAGANEINIHWATNNQPVAAGIIYVYLEAYKPLFPF